MTKEQFRQKVIELMLEDGASQEFIQCSTSKTRDFSRVIQKL